MMSAQSKGTASSSSSPSEGPPAASKAKVKEQIKIIVEDLELVLGDLKDVAKELKESAFGPLLLILALSNKTGNFHCRCEENRNYQKISFPEPFAEGSSSAYVMLIDHKRIRYTGFANEVLAYNLISFNPYFT
ncbi:hypothetical protein Q9233_015544 [Columba guinea]|nr:hypothetical protein Q9233_015544 [Columba guinea]